MNSPDIKAVREKVFDAYQEMSDKANHWPLTDWKYRKEAFALVGELGRMLSLIDNFEKERK